MKDKNSTSSIKVAWSPKAARLVAGAVAFLYGARSDKPPGCLVCSFGDKLIPDEVVGWLNSEGVDGHAIRRALQERRIGRAYFHSENVRLRGCEDMGCYSSTDDLIFVLVRELSPPPS